MWFASDLCSFHANMLKQLLIDKNVIFQYLITLSHKFLAPGIYDKMKECCNTYINA